MRSFARLLVKVFPAWAVLLGAVGLFFGVWLMAAGHPEEGVLNLLAAGIAVKAVLYGIQVLKGDKRRRDDD